MLVAYLSNLSGIPLNLIFDLFAYNFDSILGKNMIFSPQFFTLCYPSP